MSSIKFDYETINNVLCLIEDNSESMNEIEYIKMCNMMRFIHNNSIKSDRTINYNIGDQVLYSPFNDNNLYLYKVFDITNDGNCVLFGYNEYVVDIDPTNVYKICNVSNVTNQILGRHPKYTFPEPTSTIQGKILTDVKYRKFMDDYGSYTKDDEINTLQLLLSSGDFNDLKFNNWSKKTFKSIIKKHKHISYKKQAKPLLDHTRNKRCYKHEIYKIIKTSYSVLLQKQIKLVFDT